MPEEVRRPKDSAMTTQPRMVWPDLVRELDENHGISVITMETLRLLEGAQRIGPGVIGSIKDRLNTLGVGHLPRELPSRADDPVLLYRHGTLASEVIRAVQDGLSPSVIPATVDALRTINTPASEEVVAAREVAAKATQALDALTELLSMTGEDIARLPTPGRRARGRRW